MLRYVASLTPFFLALLSSDSLLASYVIDFETLATPPGVTNFSSVSAANGGNPVVGNVDFGADYSVVGGQYVEAFNNQGGTNPFATPRSGDYAIFNNNGIDSFEIATADILLSVWVGRPDMGIGPRGTNEVTVHALAGASIIGSEIISLVDSTPVELDTSSFLGLTGVTGYRFNRVATGSDGYGGGHYILDDFIFQAIPEPSSLVIATVGLVGYNLRRRRCAFRF